MSSTVHLWAIGFGDTSRAEQVRAVVNRLAGTEHCLIVHDIAVVVRGIDGSFTLDGQPLAVVRDTTVSGRLNILALLALSVPLLSAHAVDATFGGATENSLPDGVIDKSFIRDVAQLMKPATSALFVLDETGDMDAVLRSIRGLGGTVLRTNVNVSHAALSQSTLTNNPGTEPG